MIILENMNNLPLVSVVMAAYNAEKTICTSIESVLSQTYSNFELLVVNDCSSDKTREIVLHYQQIDSRVVLIDNARNQGVSFTRHNGLINSRGDMIAILDSDDYWLPNKLEKQVLLYKETGAKLIFTGSSYIDWEGNPYNWIMHVPKYVDYNVLLKQNYISNSSALVEKSIYEKFESPGDRMHEDYACWLKVLRSGVLAYGIDEPLLVYRISKKSKSGNKIKSGVMIWRTYRYIGLNHFWSLYYLLYYFFNGSKKHYRISHS